MRTCTVLCMEGEDESSADSEGPQTLCFKQRLEKSTGGEVVLMEWSPTMDLLAAVFKDHSVRATAIAVLSLMCVCAFEGGFVSVILATGLDGCTC